MDNILHDAWILFVAIGSWLANKLSHKLDTLDKDKADAHQINEAVRQLNNKINDVEKKVDKLGLTSIGRTEYKLDLDKTVEKINAIHIRVNDMERVKQDKVRDIRIVENADDKKRGK